MRLIDADKLDMSVKVDGDRTLSPISQLIAQTIIENAQTIESLPPAIPQPKIGHWEWVQYDYNPKLGDWHCSECRSVVIECANKEEKGGIPLYKYCPQCGTKMLEIPTDSEKE